MAVSCELTQPKRVHLPCSLQTNGTSQTLRLHHCSRTNQMETDRGDLIFPLEMRVVRIQYECTLREN